MERESFSSNFMDALKFTLRGKTAFFKVPEVNSYCYFTYGNIHKPALLGLIGAILGYKGYGRGNHKKQQSNYPEYYEKLKDLQVAIIPESPNGYFPKKMQVYNNTIGYANQGSTLNVWEQWLENPKWTIYVALNQECDLKSIETCVYIPYLGKNDHPAIIEDAEIVFLQEIQYDILQLHSLSPANKVYYDWEKMKFKYEEFLPISLKKGTNHYQMQKFILTDAPVIGVEESVYQDDSRNIMFF